MNGGAGVLGRACFARIAHTQLGNCSSTTWFRGFSADRRDCTRLTCGLHIWPLRSLTFAVTSFTGEGGLPLSAPCSPGRRGPALSAGPLSRPFFLRFPPLAVGGDSPARPQWVPTRLTRCARNTFLVRSADHTRLPTYGLRLLAPPPSPPGGSRFFRHPSVQ